MQTSTFLLGGILLFSTTAGHAADVAPPENNVNQITKAALGAGVVSCIPRINQVSNFATTGSERSSGYLLLPGGNPDQMLISAALEVQSKNAPPVYFSASFAPNQANGCGAEYESVTFWEDKCEQVADKQYPSLKRTGELLKDILVLDGGRFMKVFLMRAGKGCVSIKKELVS